MDPEFDDIYHNQVQTFRAMQQRAGAERVTPQSDGAARSQAMEMVDMAVNDALKHIGSAFDVRSDAKLFLTSNLLQMVALPLLLRKPSLPVARIQETLVRDAGQIAQAATKYVEGKREISAAAMLRGSVDVLPKLRLKEWRLWDRR